MEERSAIKPLVVQVLASLAVYGGIIHKWKNHFSEIKGDVAMSLHEKEGEQEDA